MSLALLLFRGGGAASTTYTITPSGGILYSGNILFIRARAQTASGFLSLSGGTALVRLRAQTASGSILFSGSSSQIHTRVEPVSGLVTFSGSAPLSFTSGAGSGGGNQRATVGTGI